MDRGGSGSLGYDVSFPLLSTHVMGVSTQDGFPCSAEGGSGPETPRKAHRSIFSPAQLTLTNILLNLTSEETTTVLVSTVYHDIPSSLCLKEQVRASWRILRPHCQFITHQGSLC